MDTLKLNVFSENNLFKELKNVVSEKRNAYSINDETINKILNTESCPTLIVFWQNLVKNIIFDVLFESESTIPNIIMRYKHEEIDISIHASTKDCIAIKIFYEGCVITDLRNLDSNIYNEFAMIIKKMSDLIITIVPDKPVDVNAELCSILHCT
jgi:hypothetical protein